MIELDEKTFARSFHSFWHDALPFAEDFVRQTNAGVARPFADEMRSSPHIDPILRAIVNETSNRLIGRALGTGSPDLRDTLTRQRGLWAPSLEEAVRHVSGYSRVRRLDVPAITWRSWREILRLALRTLDGLAAAGVEQSSLVARPKLSGYGVLVNCEGDFASDDVLVEIKSTSRAFRGEDFRQILVYLGLAYAAERPYRSVVIINPRRGVVFRTGVEQLCVGMAGEPASWVLSRTLAFLSAVGEREGSP